MVAMIRSNLGAASDFTSITTGISSLISPLAQAGVSVYLTEEQLNAQKELIKAQQAQAQAQANVMSSMVAIPQAINPMILIIGGIAFVVVILIILMSGKSSTNLPGQSGSYVIKKVIRKTPSKKKI